MKKNVGKCKLRIAASLLGTALLFAGCDLSLNNGSERLNENDETSIAKELYNSGVSVKDLAKAGVSVNALVNAGINIQDLLASGVDLYSTSNTSDDWLGSDSQGYLLNVGKVAASSYIIKDSTYGKVINAYAAQSTTTAPDVSGAKVIASNPLSGTKASSVTLYARVKNAESQNGFDTLLGFCKAGTAWSYCGLYESGGVHANSAGYFDNIENLWSDSGWHTVVLVMNARTYSFYIDGTAKVTDGDIFAGENTPVAADAAWANTYWSSTADKFIVGPGLIWEAGHVDEGACISDVALFPRALTASEIEALADKTADSSENNTSSTTNEGNTTVSSLLNAGADVGTLLASGKDLYNSGNTSDDWLGSDEKGYLLNVSKVAAETYISDDTTYGKVIDAYAAQSTTTAPDVSGAKITASNPLAGTSATSVTLYARVKNASGQNGYDSLVTFCGTGYWTSCAIMEAGGTHANSGGYFDNVDNLWADAGWHTVVLVMNANTYSLYIDGVAKVSDAAISASTGNWANTYWGTTCTSMAVGAGFTKRLNEDDLWAAGWVDSGAYISDIALFPRALTAVEIAALEVE